MKGTTTVLDEMRDTVGLFMRSLDISTDDPTYAKAEPAFDKLQAAFDDNKIDGTNGNEYVNDLGNGNLAAAFAWSGDVAQITLSNPDVRFAVPESGGMLWSDNFMIPYTTDKADLASQFINFFYEPANAATLMAYIQYISPVEGVADELGEDGWQGGQARRQPAREPDRRVPGDPLDLRAAGPEGGGGVRQALRGDHRLRLMPTGTVERDDQGRKRARWAPWMLLGPGLIFLFIFFFFPLYTLFRMSLSAAPTRFSDPVFDWHWDNYSSAFSSVQRPVLPVVPVRRSSRRCSRCVIAYPLAYVIAFRGGKYKNILLGLVVVPFFTNFLIRTLAWKTILGDQGTVVGLLRDIGILGPNGTLLRTPWAVIGGITYNFLPFMVLPIYVALEKIDPRLIDAARDLYSNTWRAFRKVVFPLSLPGVFAGSLLVFIPAAGDFVNAYYLGSAKNTMIGNVVQNQFLVQVDYPVAAALSFVFMAIVMVIVIVYAMILGTEDLT